MNVIERSDEKMENFSKRTGEKLENFQHSVTNSFGLQILGMKVMTGTTDSTKDLLTWRKSSPR